MQHLAAVIGAVSVAFESAHLNRSAVEAAAAAAALWEDPDLVETLGAHIVPAGQGGG
jgi:hypothetical protein